MFFSRILIFGFLFLFIKFCEDETDPCLESAIPDPFEMKIYFEWYKYCAGGKTWKFDDSNRPDIPEKLQNRTIIVTFYKKHCGGQLSSPMEYRYLIRERAIKKEGIGNSSINISNQEEEFLVDMKYQGAAAVSHSRHINYPAILDLKETFGNIVLRCYLNADNEIISTYPSICL